MRARAILIPVVLSLVLIGCAPAPLPTPTPTVAPIVVTRTPAPTFTPDPRSTDSWGSLAVADPGFSIRFPPGWKASQAQLGANQPMQGMDLDGPEGRVELRWGKGFGGACAATSALNLAGGQARVCHLVAEDGTQRWEQLYAELKTATFAARAETKDASEESADLVRRILGTLAFDQPPVVAQPTAPAGEIIVDNAEFALTGDWYAFDGGQNYGADCLLALPGVAARAEARPALPGVAARAEARPALPGAGQYEVFGWWCGNPNADQTRKGSILVHRAANDPAPGSLMVDYTADAGGWQSLGKFNLQPGAFLEILSAVDGSVPAGAFRFVPSGPAATEAPATPAATPGPLVSHNPPSPLQQVTQGDLAARLALNDPFYASMTMTPTELNFDDCADFPREGCGGERKGWEAIVAYQGITLTYRVSDDYRLVALGGAESLDPWTMGQAHPQRVFLRGSDARGAWAVHYRPDTTWMLLRYGTDATPPSETRLRAEQGALIRELAAKYSTISVNAAASGLTLYGLGPAVAPTEEDRSALEALGAAIAR